MKFTSLTQRLLVWFLLVGVFPLVVLGILLLHNNEQSLRNSALQAIAQLADKKAQQINGYIAERISDTRLIARSQITREAVAQLAQFYRVAHPGSADYRNADARFRAYFQRYVDDRTMFYDVFLIDMQGNVVYTQKHESDFSTNLLDGPYRTSGLANAYRNSLMSMEGMASDFKYYEPSKAMAAFIAVPVIGDGKLLGAIAFQLDITEINQVAQDPIGLGSSGETVLAKLADPQHAMITTPLKYPDQTFLRPVELGRIPVPMSSALSGNRGGGIGYDYRDRQVIAAWRYLPDLRFGMVVKMDADEALAPLYRQRVFILTSLVLALLLASLVAYFFSRQISMPLKGLVQTAEDLAGGNLDRRADESAPGELGLLARTFNRMAASLDSSHRMMEDRVEKRTAELTQKMAELRIMEAAIASSINAIAIAGLDGRIFYVNQAYVDLWRLRGPGDAIGHMPTEFVEYPEDALRAIGVMREQGYWQGQLLGRRPDGSQAELEVSAHMAADADGKPLCMMASFVDITERKLVEIELQRNRDFLNESQRMAHIGNWELVLVSGVLRWSDEVYRIFELDPAQFRPSYESFLDVIHPDDRNRVNQAYTQSLKDRQPYDVMHRLIFADGRIKWVREYCSSEFDESGKPLRSVGTVQDITEQKLVDDQLRIAATAFETQEAILITDANERILRVNNAFERITGYGAEEVIGHTPHLLSSGRHDQAFYEAMWQEIGSKGYWEGEIWDKRKNGEIYPKWLTITAVQDASNRICNYVGIFSDISQRMQAEEDIYRMAYYDVLTRLPNRRLLMDRCELALGASERNGSYGAVLFLDLDKFKILNDTLGHGFGDLLLVEVAARLKSCVRETDTLARMGGDEFVVLVENIGQDYTEASQKVAHLAEKIRAALAQPYVLEHYEQFSSTSIGVCLYRGRDETVESILKHADMAMYQAKDAGRNTVRFFDPVMQQAVETRAELEADLRGALQNRQLHLYYQIQVDDGHRPIGAEALIRWIHPVRGLVSPAQFIPLAEESSLILDIGHWVIETACRQISAWAQDEQMRNLQLAINVSAQQFRMEDFVERLQQVIVRHGIAPERLKLELTESVVLEDVADVVGKMHALKALGVGLSLDDFGTGYSSLAYLKRLPLDQIKIDQSFVRDITTDLNDAVMVKTIIDLAQNFRLNVIAEGVETEAQLAFLRNNNCMAYQGYLFSKPLPLADFEALARRLSA